MPAFAAPEDLAAILGQELQITATAGYQLVLEMATALIQDEAKQTISFVAADSVELRGTYEHTLWLPERPVVDVTAVRIRNGSVFASEFPLVSGADYRWDRMGLLRRVTYITGRLLSPVSGYWGGPLAVVDVTYSHGYPTVPDRVKALCLSVSARIVTNPRGVVRETRGPFTTQFDRAIPHFTLNEHEVKVARGFRRGA